MEKHIASRIKGRKKADEPRFTFFLLCLSVFLSVGVWPVEGMKVKVTQSCPTLCNAMDYTVLGILQTRILEWVGF